MTDCAVVVVVTIDPTKNKVAKETNAAVDELEVENFMVIVVYRNKLLLLGCKLLLVVTFIWRK